MTSRYKDHVIGGTHILRPAANAVPVGTTYSCTDHNVEYQSDGAAWNTRSTFGTAYDPEAVRDTIGAALVAGANVTIIVNDAGDTITISSATDPEVVRDTIGAALVAGANMTITVNDAGDTITLASTTDPEVVRDTIGTALVAGTGITITVNDPGDTITIAATGGGGGGGGTGGSNFLAVQQYAPASQVTLAGPTATTFADIDATNAAITVVVPTSGKVLITAEMALNISPNNRTKINLREGSSDVAGTVRMLVNDVMTATVAQRGGLQWSWLLTGLTPGTTHTYKLGWARATGTTTTDIIVDNGSGDWGTLLITAQDPSGSGIAAGSSPLIARQVYYDTNDLKFSTTSWAALVTAAGASVGTALDLTLSSTEVAVGDLLEVGFSGTWKNEAIDGYITFGSLVGGSIVNTILGADRGIPGAWGIASAYSNASGSAFYTVQAGDLSSGALTLRPLGRGAAAGDKSLLAAAPNGAQFWVKNWSRGAAGSGGSGGSAGPGITTGQAEFSYAMPSTGATGYLALGTPTLVPAKSTDTAFATPGSTATTCRFTANKAGVYSLAAFAALSSQPSGRTFLSITRAGVEVARTDIVNGVTEDAWGVSATGLYMAVGDTLDVSLYKAVASPSVSANMKFFIEYTSGIAGGSSTGGGPIAVTPYSPGTLTSLTTTSTTLVDVDATNLAVTFVAPPSGKVIVRLSALAGIDSTNGQLYWGLREGSTALLDKQIDGLNSSTTNLNISTEFVISGLTPGSIHTYKWAWRIVTGGATPTGRMYAGDVAGQAIMEVSAVGAVAAGGRDRRWTPQSSGLVFADEFNDDSIDSAWVRVDGTGAPAGNVTWTEGADSLSCYNAGGDSVDALHALLRPVGTAMAAGDAIIGHVSILAGLVNYSFVGLMLSDSATHGSGKQITSVVGLRSTGMSIGIDTWTNFTVLGTATDIIAAPAMYTSVYLRLVMLAANSFRVDVSPDGVSWIKGSATAFTMTPTHMGFWSTSYGSATKHIASFEFLRRVSGVS